MGEAGIACGVWRRRAQPGHAQSAQPRQPTAPAATPDLEQPRATKGQYTGDRQAVGSSGRSCPVGVVRTGRRPCPCGIPALGAETNGAGPRNRLVCAVPGAAAIYLRGGWRHHPLQGRNDPPCRIQHARNLRACLCAGERPRRTGRQQAEGTAERRPVQPGKDISWARPGRLRPPVAQTHARGAQYRRQTDRQRPGGTILGRAARELV